LETFAAPRELVANERYERDRSKALAGLDVDAIDAPIRGLIRDFTMLPHCFTLQCCWGHFFCRPGQDPRTLEPVPETHVGPVRYRIAYLVACVENSAPGRRLLGALSEVTAIDRSMIQFGSPEWFVRRCPNAYALQVEPSHSMLKDEAVLTRDEALLVQRARDRFFAALRGVVARELGMPARAARITASGSLRKPAGRNPSRSGTPGR
jgi:hypothetical protein